MKIKSMTDDEIESFNLAVHTLRENLESLRNTYQTVEENIDELGAATGAIDVDEEDDNIKENLNFMDVLCEARNGIEQLLTELEEVVDELELVEKDKEESDED